LQEFFRTDSVVYFFFSVDLIKFFLCGQDTDNNSINADSYSEINMFVIIIGLVVTTQNNLSADVDGLKLQCIVIATSFGCCCCC